LHDTIHDTIIAHIQTVSHSRLAGVANRVDMEG